MTWVDAADASLPDESVARVEAGGTAIALARVDGAWHAVETWCTHAECPLTTVGSRARRSAARATARCSTSRPATPLEGPAEEPVAVFPTRVAATASRSSP